MSELPREVHNASTRETVRFVLTAEETGGELLVMEATWRDPAHSTPAHLHPGMEERWQIVEGTVGFRIGEEERTLSPGETITAPAGVRHSNWSVGGPAVMRIVMRPPLRWEDFVRQLFALASEDLEDETARRSVQELLTEFAGEIEL